MDYITEEEKQIVTEALQKLTTTLDDICRRNGVEQHGMGPFNSNWVGQLEADIRARLNDSIKEVIDEEISERAMDTAYHVAVDRINWG